jgi:hypothetical protein
MFLRACGREWRRKHRKKRSVGQVAQTEQEVEATGAAAISTEIRGLPVEAGVVRIEIGAEDLRQAQEIAGQAPVVGVEVDHLDVEASGTEMVTGGVIALEVAMVVMAEGVMVAEDTEGGTIPKRTVKSRSYLRRQGTQQGLTSTTMMRFRWRLVVQHSFVTSGHFGCEADVNHGYDWSLIIQSFRKHSVFISCLRPMYSTWSTARSCRCSVTRMAFILYAIFRTALFTQCIHT